VEFCANSSTYRLASMYINFNDENVQYLWQLENHEINIAQLDLMSNSLDLEGLTKAVGKRLHVFI